METEKLSVQNFDEIHIWQFPEGTTVKLKEEFIIRINLI